MSRQWMDDERPVFPVNRDSVWGVLFLVLGFMILVFTPPDSMSPWVFGVACIGSLAGLVLVALGYREEMES